MIGEEDRAIVLFRKLVYRGNSSDALRGSWFIRGLFSRLEQVTPGSADLLRHRWCIRVDRAKRELRCFMGVVVVARNDLALALTQRHGPTHRLQ